MDKVSELDVRLLNALDTDFDALYEASNKMLKLIDKASKDMEYILHKPVLPYESKLEELAYSLNQYLYLYKSKSWEGGCDYHREQELRKEHQKIFMHQIAVEEMLKNKKLIVEEDDDMKTAADVYYHGTDLRLAKLSDEERAIYKKDCMQVIDYMWQFFGPIYQRDAMIKELKEPLDFYEDSTLYYNLQDALTRNNARKIGNQLYQYDCFYLTSLKKFAKDYAYKGFAGGEIGLTAYRMIEAANKIKFDGTKLSNDIRASIDRITTFAETPAQPVIFVFNNLEKEYIEMEDGSKIDWSRKRRIQNIRYTNPIIFDTNKAIEVKLIKLKDLKKDSSK